jgi:hypothetical protein
VEFCLELAKGEDKFCEDLRKLELDKRKAKVFVKVWKLTKGTVQEIQIDSRKVLATSHSTSPNQPFSFRG